MKKLILAIVAIFTLATLYGQTPQPFDSIEVTNIQYTKKYITLLPKDVSSRSDLTKKIDSIYGHHKEVPYLIIFHYAENKERYVKKLPAEPISSASNVAEPKRKRDMKPRIEF